MIMKHLGTVEVSDQGLVAFLTSIFLVGIPGFQYTRFFKSDDIGLLKIKVRTHGRLVGFNSKHQDNN